jgi:hypothetical protein
MDYNILDTTYTFPDLSWLVKVPLAILLAGVIFYNIMMILRVRILSDTIDSSDNPNIKKLAYVHTVLSIAGCLVSLVLILLG